MGTSWTIIIGWREIQEVVQCISVVHAIYLCHISELSGINKLTVIKNRTQYKWDLLVILSQNITYNLCVDSHQWDDTTRLWSLQRGYTGTKSSFINKFVTTKIYHATETTIRLYVPCQCFHERVNSQPPCHFCSILVLRPNGIPGCPKGWCHCHCMIVQLSRLEPLSKIYPLSIFPYWVLVGHQQGCQILSKGSHCRHIFPYQDFW